MLLTVSLSLLCGLAGGTLSGRGAHGGRWGGHSEPELAVDRRAHPQGAMYAGRLPAFVLLSLLIK